MASYEDLFNRIDRQLSVLTWMVGLNIALTAASFGVVFGLFSRLCGISGQLATIARGLGH